MFIKILYYLNLLKSFKKISNWIKYNNLNNLNFSLNNETTNIFREFKFLSNFLINKNKQNSILSF